MRKRFINWLFYSAAGLFVITYFVSVDISKIDGVSLGWPYVLLAVLFSLCFRYWGGFVWVVLLKGLGGRKMPRLAEIFSVYSKSWLGRYIPGTAPAVLAKIHLASQLGIPRQKLAVSTLLEGGLRILVVMSMSFIMLMVDTRLEVIGGSLRWLMVGVILVMVILMTPPVFNMCISRMYLLLRKQALSLDQRVDYKTVFRGAGLYAIGALLSGLAFFFIAMAVYPEIGFNNILFIMGTGNLAGVIGMLVVFVPSGLGVREGVQVALLQFIMPIEAALFVTITMRLWGITMDLIFFLLTQSVLLTTHSYRFRS